MTGDAGERSSLIPAWEGEADTYFRTSDVLGSMLGEPRYRNGIFVDQGLRHNLLGEQNRGVQARMAVPGAWR